MRKVTYINCHICGKEFQSLGYASHRAMHRRERERAKKLQQQPVIKSVCGDCLYYLTCNHESRDKLICDNFDNEP